MGSNLNRCGECIKASCKNCHYYVKPTTKSFPWRQVIREGLEGLVAGSGMVVLVYVFFIV